MIENRESKRYRETDREIGSRQEAPKERVPTNAKDGKNARELIEGAGFWTFYLLEFPREGGGEREGARAS